MKNYDMNTIYEYECCECSFIIKTKCAYKKMSKSFYQKMQYHKKEVSHQMKFYLVGSDDYNTIKNIEI